jgi:hypothetical protein
MIEWRTLDEVIKGRGLRMVLVQGIASPWGIAAKAIFDLKGVPYIAAPWAAGETNETAAQWSGADGGPVVVWNDEAPLNRWLDILMLAERIAPTPALLPADPLARALAIGLSFEICGENGLGWNRRLQLFEPMIESGQAPEGVLHMGRKYGYSAAAAAAAKGRVIAQLRALIDEVRQAGAGAVVLAGAVLAGHAPQLQQGCDVPLIDAIPAAVARAETLAHALAAARVAATGPAPTR